MTKKSIEQLTLFYQEHGFSHKGFVPVVYDPTFPRGAVEPLISESVILCMYYNTDFGVEVLRDIKKLAEKTSEYKAGFLLYMKDGSYLTHRGENLKEGFSILQFMMKAFIGLRLANLIIGIGGKDKELFPRTATCRKGKLMYVGDGRGSSIGFFTDESRPPAIHYRGKFLIDYKKKFTRMFHSTWEE